MTSDRRGNFDFERLILRDIRLRFATDTKYPISRRMYHRALSRNHWKEGRWALRNQQPGLLGAIARALVYDPLNSLAYRLAVRSLITRRESG